jgi:hypothetical protein
MSLLRMGRLDTLVFELYFREARELLDLNDILKNPFNVGLLRGHTAVQRARDRARCSQQACRMFNRILHLLKLLAFGLRLLLTLNVIT